MTPDQNVAQKSAAPNGSRDLISRLYREIGISAVAAALEAIARKPAKSRCQAARTSLRSSGATRRHDAACPGAGTVRLPI